MAERIVVFGAGGFGRETLDVIEAAVAAGADYEVLGVVDAAPREIDVRRLSDRRTPFLGSDEEWLPTAHPDTLFVVAIGDTAAREKVAHRARRAGLRPGTVVHPRAVVGTRSKIGDGVVICAGAQISTNVTVGDHVHLNPGCIIGHDVELEEYVSVNPGAIVSGNVLVRKGALLGAGAIVLQGLTVASGTTVGAGACVTKDTDGTEILVGVPARPMGDRSL